MTYTIKDSEKSQKELVFTISPDEYKKDLESAATRLSERAAIKGFRPGKAPYKIVKEQVGELKILEEAAEPIIQKSFFEAIKKESLETVGSPKITVEKLAPGNDFVYKAIVFLMPEINLADLEKIKLEKKEPKITDKEVADVLENLKKMQPKEVIKNSSADEKDKVVVDMEMFVNNVPMEGGQAKDHQVYLSEKHYIPGFAEKLVGLKKDDAKKFSLKFPEEHYQKQFAGKDVDFKVKAKEVYTIEYPELNDDFAKRLGQESVAKLKELVSSNLLAEAKRKEEERIEIEMLEQLMEKSSFEEIPENLIDAEKQKIFYELKHNLEKNGITIENYLKDLKKTEEEIFKDFTEQAIKRIKAALISRKVAMENNITVENKEIQDEAALIKEAYKNDAKVEENLKRPEVLDTIAMTLQNRKVLTFLKEKILK